MQEKFADATIISITTLNIMTLSVMTFGIMAELIVTYAECHI